MIDDWLRTATGQNLLAQERYLVGEVLDRVFGDQIVQLGAWGATDLFLSRARTQCTGLFSTEPGYGVDAVAVPQRLPLQADSVDALLLPHTLELARDPYSVLREVHRVLRPDGRVIILGFNPASWWGIRHSFSRAGFPPGIRRQISQRRLRDWLRLLELDVERGLGCYVSASAGRPGQFWRQMPWFASGYLLIATKASVPMTVIRPRQTRRTAIVSSLPNPSTRNVS